MSRGYFAIGLDNPKTPHNIGSAIRAAGCYGAAFLATTGTRYRKASTDVLHGYRTMPLFHNTASLRDLIPYDCVPVAVELCEGAVSLVDFVHPERAFYIFGAEDNTLGARVLDWCPRKIMVPTRACMNLAACVNVVLYDRMAKRGGVV